MKTIITNPTSPSSNPTTCAPGYTTICTPVTSAQKRMERRFDWCDSRQRTAFIVNVICKNGGWCRA